MSLREWEKIWRKRNNLLWVSWEMVSKSFWNQDKQLPLVYSCPLSLSPHHRRVVGQAFQLYKHMLTNPNYWLFLIWLETASKRFWCITFPRNAVRLTGLQLSSSCFLFLKTGVMWLFSILMKLSPSPQPFKYDNDRPHNANFLNTQGFILSDPVDLCMSSSFKCFLSWSCSIEGISTFLQTFSWVGGSLYPSGQS